MSMTQIYGMRGVAGVSLLTALVTIALSMFIFSARLEDLLTSKFPASEVPLNISSWSHRKGKDNQEYGKVLQVLNELWAKYRPAIVVSSGLAAAAALIQGIFSVLVVLTDTKYIRIYVRKWMVVHFVLIFVYFIIILNTIVLTGHGKDPETWKSSIESFKNYLKRERPANDYSKLFRFLGVNQQLIYITAGTDLGMIILLMCAMLEFIRRLKDYEAYE